MPLESAPTLPAQEPTVPEYKDDPKLSNEDALEQMGQFFLVGNMELGMCQELAAALLRRASVFMAPKPMLAPTFTIHISSIGGVADGMFLLGGAIMAVRRMGVNVVTHVVHEASSAAAGILQYGSSRTAEVDATLMIHDFQSWLGYGSTYEHREQMGNVDRGRLKYASVFSKANTAGHNDPRWWMDNYMGREETYLSALEAKELGLIDAILPDPLSPSPELPSSSSRPRKARRAL